MNPRHFLAELKRRNVIRAAILYGGTVWALAQGISQLGSSVGAPDWTTRWFLVAAGIGFPFWMAFAWFYEFTPEGVCTQVVEKQKDYGPPLGVLGLIDAALGNTEAALAEGRRVMELLSVEKDSIGGQVVRAYHPMIAAWVGEKDLALEQVATTASTFRAATVASYGVRKLLPLRDPLRGDPRLEKIVAAFAPKESAAAAK
jgi:hypothetical protein